jgi:hypothetical protein
LQLDFDFGDKSHKNERSSSSAAATPAASQNPLKGRKKKSLSSRAELQNPVTARKNAVDFVGYAIIKSKNR